MHLVIITPYNGEVSQNSFLVLANRSLDQGVSVSNFGGGFPLLLKVPFFTY
jgi:hypothetical protein